MIAVSLLMVLVAAGSLVATIAGAGRDLVWVAIGAAVLAIASVAVAVRRRRGQALDPATRNQPGAPHAVSEVAAVEAPPWPPRLRPGDRLAPAGTVAGETGAAGRDRATGSGSYPTSGSPATGPGAVPADRSAPPGDRTTDPAASRTDSTDTAAAIDAGYADGSAGDSAATAAAAGDPSTAKAVPEAVTPPPDEPAQEQLTPDERSRLTALARAGAEPRSGSDATPAVAVEEVMVVDGRPRFHRAYCSHLTGRTPMSLSLAEALDLGFTPCAWCRPAAYLLASAGRHGR